MDLRFEDIAVEQEYTRSLESDILTSFSFCVLPFGIFWEFFFIQATLQEQANENNPFVWDPADPRSVTLMSSLVAGSLVLFLPIVAMLQLRRRIPSVLGERFIVLFWTLVGALIIAMNRDTICRLYGLNPADIWVASGDFVMVTPLLLVLIVTCGSICIPVRFNIMCILPMNLVLIAALVWSNVGTDVPATCAGVTVVLVSLIFLASWRWEHQRREKWAAARLVTEADEQMREQQRELESKELVIREQKSEIDEQLHGVVPELPGAYISTQSSDRERRGGRISSLMQDGFERSPSGRMYVPNSNGALDGSWEVIDAPEMLSSWLSSFKILGSIVIDGEGNLTRLTISSCGEVLFHGRPVRLLESGNMAITTRKQVIEYTSVSRSAFEEDNGDCVSIMSPRACSMSFDSMPGLQ